jgi:hypothetical protein
MFSRGNNKGFINTFDRNGFKRRKYLWKYRALYINEAKPNVSNILLYEKELFQEQLLFVRMI